MMTHFLATVEFAAHRSLSELAADLVRLFGIPLARDDSDRFDEVPVYVGNVGEVQFTLFGPTDEQTERECVLELLYEISLSVKEAQAAVARFLQPIFEGAKAEPTGYVDCSAALSSLLISRGFDDCKPVR